MRRIRLGGTAIPALLIGISACSASAISSRDEPPADIVSVKQRLAERAVELLAVGPGKAMVLLPGAPDPGRRFTAALALAPYDTIGPYLPGLAQEWSAADAMYGPSDRPALRADITRMAARLARLSGEYRAALFPSDRLRALLARAGRSRTANEPAEVRSARVYAARLLDVPVVQPATPGTAGCARLTAAVTAGNLPAATRLYERSPDMRCANPPGPVLGRVRAEAARLAAQARGWRAPAPGQILDLRERLLWAFGYAPESVRPAVARAADAVGAYLDAHATAAQPLLPNRPSGELLSLFELLHEARPAWRPPRGHLAQLHRTLAWRGRLAEQIRNDPTTFIYTTRLIETARSPDARRALPVLKAGILAIDDPSALDAGLRAVAVQRRDLITDARLAAAAAQAGEDSRLAARLAALVSYSGRCPSSAVAALRARLQAAGKPERLPTIGVYYHALIAHALDGCAHASSMHAFRAGLATALQTRIATQVRTVTERPDWQGWFQLWLFTEPACALNLRPRLDPAALSRVATRVLSRPADRTRSTFDPATAYALSRSLDIARHGCQGAWYDPPR